MMVTIYKTKLNNFVTKKSLIFELINFNSVQTLRNFNFTTAYKLCKANLLKLHEVNF